MSQVLGAAPVGLRRSALVQEMIQLLMKKELNTAPNSGDPITGVRTFRRKVSRQWGPIFPGSTIDVGGPTSGGLGTSSDDTGCAYGLPETDYHDGICLFIEKTWEFSEQAFESSGGLGWWFSGYRGTYPRSADGLLNKFHGTVGSRINVRLAPGHSKVKFITKLNAPYETTIAHVRLLPAWFSRGDMLVKSSDGSRLIPLATTCTEPFRGDWMHWASIDKGDDPPLSQGFPTEGRVYGVMDAFASLGGENLLPDSVLEPGYDVRPDFDDDRFFKGGTQEHEIDLTRYKTTLPVREVYGISYLVHPVHDETDDWRDLRSEAHPGPIPGASDSWANQRATMTSAEFTSPKYQGISVGDETLELTHVYPWILAWSANMEGHYIGHEERITSQAEDGSRHVGEFINPSTAGGDPSPGFGSFGSFETTYRNWNHTLVTPEIRDLITGQPFYFKGAALSQDHLYYVTEACNPWSTIWTDAPDGGANYLDRGGHYEQNVGHMHMHSPNPSDCWSGLQFFQEEIPWPGTDYHGNIFENHVLAYARFVGKSHPDKGGPSLHKISPNSERPFGCVLFPWQAGADSRPPRQGDQFTLKNTPAGALPDSFDEGTGNRGFSHLKPVRVMSASDTRGYFGFATSPTREHDGTRTYPNEPAEVGLRPEMTNVMTLTFALAKVVNAGTNPLLSPGQEVMAVSTILNDGPTQRFQAGFVADPDAGEGIKQAVDIFLIPGFERTFYDQNGGLPLPRV